MATQDTDLVTAQGLRQTLDEQEAANTAVLSFASEQTSAMRYSASFTVYPTISGDAPEWASYSSSGVTIEETGLYLVTYSLTSKVTTNYAALLDVTLTVLCGGYTIKSAKVEKSDVTENSVTVTSDSRPSNTTAIFLAFNAVNGDKVKATVKAESSSSGPSVANLAFSGSMTIRKL